MKHKVGQVHSQDGSMVIWVSVLCCCAMMVCLGLAKLGNATITTSWAQNAADAAALAAAYDVAHFDSSSACKSARDTASKNNARVVSCLVSDSEVIVEVAIENQNGIYAKARAEVE